MYTTNINVLAPNTTKPVFNTKALLEALIANGYDLVPGKGIWVYTNKRKAGQVYGPHFVNLVKGDQVVRIKNSYDGTTRPEIDYGAGAQRLTNLTTVVSVFNDVIAYQPTFNSTFLTMDEQMALVVECGKTRWPNFSEEMAAEIVDTEFNVEQLKDAVLTMVLGGYKFEGQKRAKALTDPIVEWRLYQAITAIFAGAPTTPAAVAEVNIPARPNKFLYIGEGRTKRPNPAYARWMELYSDLVEAQ